MAKDMEMLQIRVLTDDMDIFRARATLAGKSLSEWAREAMHAKDKPLQTMPTTAPSKTDTVAPVVTSPHKPANPPVEMSGKKPFKCLLKGQK